MRGFSVKLQNEEPRSRSDRQDVPGRRPSSSQRAGSIPGSRRVAMMALATISAEAEEHRVAAWAFTEKSPQHPLQ
jgi:hypothetical protein